MVQLPAGVTFQKEVLSYGTVYIFRHGQLGLLGRIILQETQTGQCHISYEIAGQGTDPMTAKREVIIVPILEQIMAKMGQAFGEVPTDIPPPSRPPASGEYVTSKMLTCPKCDAGVVFLIFADGAKNVGEMEDYARKMSEKVKEINLPTYIIRPAASKENSADLPADIMKIWPEREAVEYVKHIDDFHSTISIFVGSHCG